MNEKNFDYLKDQVKYTGFGDSLENDLKGKLQMGAPEFSFSTTPNLEMILPRPPFISKSQIKATCIFSISTT
jgi:hypothetical protein